MPLSDDNVKDFTLFYAWQSDRPNRINRGFIEDAAKQALKKISLPPEVYAAPRLEQDTKGVPGTPDIANTILKKIRDSDAFLADVTLINTALDGFEESKLRPTPNPNVLIELGYALASRGSERVILVMNEYFGSFEQLPFDLRHKKRPIGYSLSPGASAQEKRTAKEQLRKDLEKAISLIAENNSRETLTNLPIVEVEWAEAVRSTFHERLRNGQFEGLDNSDGTLAITIMPGRKPGKRIDVASFEKFLWERLHPISAGGWDRRRGPRYFGTVAKDPSTRTPLDVTEFTDEKVLLAANRWLVREHGLTDKLSGRFGEGTWGIYPARIEKVAVEALTKYFSMLRDVPVPLPWLISVAILDLGPTAACSTDIRHYSSGDVVFRDRDIMPDFIEVSDEDQFSDKNQVARLLRPALNFMWRAFGYQGSPYFDRDGDWHG
jgi:hypothetical protein